ncbi:hypothetical protein [Pontivivens nitratireducens]|nr:hypothetical protein [Pontibrevibacter nitratireducens]
MQELEMDARDGPFADVEGLKKRARLDVGSLRRPARRAQLADI